jgi:DNA-binding SARP family transcriptional activator
MTLTQVLGASIALDHRFNPTCRGARADGHKHRARGTLWYRPGMSPGETALRFQVLGPLDVVVDGTRLALGGTKQRIVLALLLLEANHVVSADRLVDAVWGEDASDRSPGTLHVYLSNLRKVLEPASSALGVDSIIVTQRPGYVLRVEPSAVDALVFEEAVAAARRAAEGGRHAIAAARFREALELWHGTPLADLYDEPFAQGAVSRLEAMRVAAIEGLLEADLASGRHHAAIEQLPELIDTNPLNERLRGFLMLALYRSGRQADALAAYRDARNVLIEELGIEPSPFLRDLESRILQQDPTLDLSGSGVPAVPDLAASTMVRVGRSTTAWIDLGGQRIDLARAVTTLGRRADRHVNVPDPDVSRAHCEIRHTVTGYILIDTGSTNGTRCNGEPVGEHLLADGEVITVGATDLTFHTGD